MANRNDTLLGIAKDLNLSPSQLGLLDKLSALEKDGVEVTFGYHSGIKRDEYEFAVSLKSADWRFYGDRATDSLIDYMSNKLEIGLEEVQDAGMARNGNAYFFKDGILVEFI